MARPQHFGVGSLLCVGLLISASSRAQSAPPPPQTPPLENYVQMRYFYPPTLGTNDPLAGLTLDALYKSALEGVQLEFSVKNTNLYRQAANLNLSLESGYAALEYKGGPGSDPGARANSFSASGSYTLPKAGEVSLLSDVSLSYSLDTDSGTVNRSGSQNADLSVRGQLAKDWRWSAGYSLSSGDNASDDGAGGSFVSSSLQNAFRAEVRGKILPNYPSLELAVGGGLRLNDTSSTGQGDKQSTALDGKVELSSNLSEQESGKVSFKLSSVDGKLKDDESLSVQTTRLEPLTLSANVGRTPGFYSWGLGLDYPLDDALSLTSSYDGSLSDSADALSQDHSLNFGATYRAKKWRLGGGLGAGLNNDSGDWQASYTLKANGSYKIAPLDLSARASFALRPVKGELKPSGSVSGSVNFDGGPLKTALELGFTFKNLFTGSASLSVLYAVTESLSLNASSSYSRALFGADPQDRLSIGLGLRFSF